MSLRAWITFAALCVLWGIPYFFIKLALADLSPACVAWSRLTLGALVLVPLAWRRGVLKPVLAHKGWIVAFTIAELVIPFLLISIGEQWITSSLAGVLIATVPLMVVVIAPLFGLREDIGATRLLGLVIGLIGVLVLLGIDTIETGYQWLGVACLFVAVLGYTVGPLIVQRHLKGVDELGAIAVSFALASLILLPLALFTAPTKMPSTLGLTSVAVLGLLCTAAAMLLFFSLIHEAGASRAALVAYISPAVAALLGVGVLHEPFGVGMGLGLLLILLGSWLGSGGIKRREPEELIA